VGRTCGVHREHAAGVVDEHEGGLAAPAVDTEEGTHAPSQGYTVTPCTTRLTVPRLLGLSGVTPSDSERSVASTWATAAYGSASSRSASAPAAAPSSTRSSPCPPAPSTDTVTTRPTPSRRSSLTRSVS